MVAALAGSSLSTTSLQYGQLTLGAGSEYRLDALTGWEELPAGKLDDVARVNAHGSFDAAVWSGPRVVSASGWCWSATARDELVEAFRRAAAFGLGLQPLVGSVAGRTLTAYARVTKAGAVLTRREWGVGRFGWQVEWWCPDPLRYGTPSSASTGFPTVSGGLVFPLFTPAGVLDFGVLAEPGAVTLQNDGTAAAPTLLRVTGPTPAEGLDLVDVDSGRRLRYVDAIPAGSWVTFDSATGRVTINDEADRSGFLSIAQWWQVPAGGSSTVAFVPLGATNTTARLTGQVAPAWW